MPNHNQHVNIITYYRINFNGYFQKKIAVKNLGGSYERITQDNTV